MSLLFGHASVSPRWPVAGTVLEMQIWHSNKFDCVFWPRNREAPHPHQPELPMQTDRGFTYRQTLPLSWCPFVVSCGAGTDDEQDCPLFYGIYMAVTHTIPGVRPQQQYQLCSRSPPRLILWCVDLLRVPGESRCLSSDGSLVKVVVWGDTERQRQNEGEFERDVAQETMLCFQGDKLSAVFLSVGEGSKKEKRGEDVDENWREERSGKKYSLDIFEFVIFLFLLYVHVVLSHQGPFQLAAVGPPGFRTWVPQEVWSHRPLLLCQVTYLHNVQCFCVFTKRIFVNSCGNGGRLTRLVMTGSYEITLTLPFNSRHGASQPIISLLNLISMQCMQIPSNSFTVTAQCCTPNNTAGCMSELGI